MQNIHQIQNSQNVNNNTNTENTGENNMQNIHEEIQNMRPLNDADRLKTPVFREEEIEALKAVKEILGDTLYNKLTCVDLTRNNMLKIDHRSSLLTREEEELIVEFKEVIRKVEDQEVAEIAADQMSKILTYTRDVQKKAAALYSDNEKEQEKERKMKAAVRAGSDIEAIMDTMSDWDNARLATIKKRHAIWGVPVNVLNKVSLEVEGGDVFLTRKKGYVLTDEENAIVENFNEEINSRTQKSEALKEFLSRATFEDEYEAKFGEEAKEAKIFHEKMHEASNERLHDLAKRHLVKNDELLK